jgi:hypothetical protein
MDASERLADGGLVQGELLLADAIESLRGQLQEAVRQAQGKDPSFVCESVEVQLQVVVTNTKKAEGKLGMWSVLTVGAGVDHASAATHVVKLVLKPESGGRKIRVTDV